MLLSDETLKLIDHRMDKIKNKSRKIETFIKSFKRGDPQYFPILLSVIKDIIDNYARLMWILSIEPFSELRAFQEFKKLEKLD